MKRKTFAWLAAGAIVALVSFAFLRPASGDFGFADKLYTPSHYGYTPVRLSGDTHLIEAIELIGLDFNDIFPVMRIRIKPADDAPLLYIPLRSSHVLIERRTPQGFEYVTEVGTGYGITDLRYYHTIDEDDEFYEYWIDFPIMSEPGEYVITFRFQAAAPENEYGYSIREDGEVSFPFSLPSTDRVADAALVSVRHLGRPMVMVGLRCNEDTLYLDRETIRLEQRTAAGYEAITLPDGSAPLVVGGGYGDERYVVYDYAWRSRDPDTGERIPEPFCVYPSIVFEFDGVAEFDPEAEYRLTLDFVEDPDGSGERYALPLRVSFSQGSER